MGVGQVLDHAQAGQGEPGHDRERQQHPDDAASQVDPEVPDPVRFPADQAADQRERRREPHGRAEESLGAEAGGLGQVAERGLTRIVLPACVRREADRRVERQGRVHARMVERVRQDRLDSQQQVQQQDAGHRHREQRAQVFGPALVGVGVDTAGAVHGRLGSPVPPGAQRPGHVIPERHVEREDDRDHHNGLQPPGHGGASRL
jgi:hypothetical protein